ncbi:MAG: MBL fold metallo-hydrolase, partial [Actinomycetota bacterium]|nr:MBL fold metallo-hydrolase [Actinomycetota bacterium]
MRLSRVTAASVALTLVAGGIAVAAVTKSSRLDTRAIALREKLFGPANVDHRTGAVRRGVVILSWTSVMTYAAAIDGHVVLLDAWVARGEHSGYVPTSAAELAAIKPEFVIIGHSHFDHAADAAQIALESGAPIVGTPEHCDQIRSQALSEWGSDKVRCVAAAPRGAPFAVTTKVKLWKGIGLTTVKV